MDSKKVLLWTPQYEVNTKKTYAKWLFTLQCVGTVTTNQILQFSEFSRDEKFSFLVEYLSFYEHTIGKSITLTCFKYVWNFHENVCFWNMSVNCYDRNSALLRCFSSVSLGFLFDYCHSQILHLIFFCLRVCKGNLLKWRSRCNDGFELSIHTCNTCGDMNFLIYSYM